MKKLLSRGLDAALCGAAHALTILAVAFLVMPLVVVVIVSFNSTTVIFPPRDWSLASYMRIPQVAVDTFLRSLLLGLCCATLSALFCVPAAIAMVKSNLRGKALIEAALRSPMQFPAIILGVAILQYFYFWQGALAVPLVGTFMGLLIAHTVYTFPFVLVPTIARLSALSDQYDEAAAGLGAGSLTTLMRVIIPLMRPGIVAGMFMSFIMSFEDVAVTLFLAGSRMTTFPVYLFGSAEVSNTPSLYAVASLGSLAALSLVLIVERFIGIRTVLSKG